MGVEASVPHGIYVVEADTSPVKTRYVVIAMTGFEAAELVAAERLPDSDVETRRKFADSLEIGRLGTYDPGFRGARMVPGAVVAVQ